MVVRRNYGPQRQGLPYNPVRFVRPSCRAGWYGGTPATQQAGWRSAVKHSGYRYQLRSVTLPKTIRSGTGFAVKTWFKNVGSAPTYDAWRVELRLLDADLDLPTAYRVQRELRDAAGPLSGWKLGVTSRAKQAQVGVSDPVFGFLAGANAVDLGEPLDTSRLIQPRCEPEIVFVLGERLAALPRP